VFREGTALEALESADSRRFLPQAVVATLLVIVAPALVVVALSPLSGIADLLLSALLASGLSVAAGSAGSALWTRLPQSREIAFGELMLWAWGRRVRAERRLAKVATAPPRARRGDLAALRTLAVVYEARDGFSHGHSGRVARHAERIARRLGVSGEDVERIEAAAAVHDVGMLGVPSAILSEDLSPEERRLVERHAVHGAERVAAVAGPEVAALVRHHHERVDGMGYPDGLAGDEIPLGARIIAVADRFDELVSAAPRREPGSRRNALDELSARAGTELDPAVVAAFAGYYSGTRSIAGVAFAATAPQRAVRWIAAAPATIGSAAGAPTALQGLCAAGTAVLAGACLTGLPALESERADPPAAQQRAERAPVEGTLATPLAANGPPSAGRGDRGEPPTDSRGRGDDLPAPRSGTPQAPSGGGRGGGDGGATTPMAPRTGGGDRGGGIHPTTGSDTGGGGGGTSPPTPRPSQPSAPVQPPPRVEAPPAPPNPTSPVLDPVLDGLSDTVPETKPITDAVEGLVGGLGGVLAGEGQ
jgi:HD-GYP domain-containing protein (c-di-GMP phosphodiesterase class II)